MPYSCLNAFVKETFFLRYFEKTWSFCGRILLILDCAMEALMHKHNVWSLMVLRE